MNRKNILLVTVSVLMTLVISIPTTLVFAEQSGDSPESGVTSRIKQAYDALVTLGYGSDGSGSWGDWGNMWNRIRSAAEWTPEGTATSEDVVAGETFYGDSRTKVTGTAEISDPIDFSLQQYNTRDDYSGTYPGGTGPEDYQGDEPVWSDFTEGSDVVWKDERTGLFWSSQIGVLSNQFAAISRTEAENTCTFFDTVPRADYDGSDSDCGEAINACAVLMFGGRDDWYLPSMKEFLQAEIDGMFNHAGSTPAEAAAFTTGINNAFWTSTEYYSDSSDAWINYIINGTYYGSKTISTDVRCVARD